MPRITTTITITAALALCAPVIAHADANDAKDQQLTASMRTAHHSFGFRVGGYGFRNTTHPDKGEWDDCRMNGVGLFGQRTLTKHLFAEAAFDIYSAEDLEEQLDSGAPVMDRVSGIGTLAGGAKMSMGRFTPYIQAGLGLEMTRVRMGEFEERKVFPMGFIGLGADLRITGSLHIGANLRTNVMRHYAHDGGELLQSAGGDRGHEMASEYDTAAQGQFFLKYTM
jgi:hypothetical protein